MVLTLAESKNRGPIHVFAPFPYKYSPPPLTHPWAAGVVVGLSLLASACGDTAETRETGLATSGDVSDIEVLSVDDDSVSNRSDTVISDSPVLL